MAMTGPSDLRELIYEENVRAPMWVILLLGLFLGGSVGLITAFAIRSFMGDPIVEGGEATAAYVILILYALLDLFLLVNFTNLAVSVSRGSIELRYGVFSKRIDRSTVSDAEVRNYQWATYGGWGLRIAFGSRRAWSMLGVPKGVLVSVEEGGARSSYFVSSRDPDRLAAAIQNTDLVA